jgi:hypothetical protein
VIISFCLSSDHLEIRHPGQFHCAQQTLTFSLHLPGRFLCVDSPRSGLGGEPRCGQAQRNHSRRPVRTITTDRLTIPGSELLRPAEAGHEPILGAVPRASKLTSAAEVWLVEGEGMALPWLRVGVAVGVLVGSAMPSGSAMRWGSAMP